MVNIKASEDRECSLSLTLNISDEVSSWKKKTAGIEAPDLGICGC